MRQNITAGKKLVRIRDIESFQPIGLVKSKLLVYDSVIILVQFLILNNLFPYTMPIIVIRNGIFMTFSPQKVLKN
jgi:hypothetical protein